MEERGFGYIADILVFALLISTAILLLAGASLVDPRAESTRYAASFAQSTLLSFQHSTADQFGGFEYTLGAFGFELDLPVVGDSAKRQLHHKTLAQLLAEDALLNLRVDAEGTGLTFMRQNQGMDDELRSFLKSALDRMIGGRFSYRLRARTEPIDFQFARVYFETEIEDLTRARAQLCCESVMLSLPAPKEELIQRVEEAFGTSFLGLELADPVIEVSLELWSR
ncbi:MAG: hypothetical protein QMD95_04325 [Candidatus Hodarchaeaceae archaeon]|nr:hypothetical protein [Candidatus Hodarchaeaceae archaeon]